ncbi:hypothetical protein [Actinophytocola gossypii]|uniref:WXG100 family type VII secretion target n=1 Tax=Actinophytocola gossypii TaxID=2812003 RepID=A0ABT2J773_9PSEU|nr:hypothetical protein [Actinophytocola gossypii]MCT2583718.1 hypothetical protein [Actinophytocola gossypii]
MQPAALRELASLLDRAKDDSQAGRKYLADEVSEIDGEGLINRITASHDTVVRTLDTWFGEVADMALASTSTAVTEAAAYYERTDQNVAARLDDTYPPAELSDAREHTDYVPIEPPEDTARFGDVVEPQRHLIDPTDYTQKLDATPGWWEAGSPMALFGSPIELVTGIDPQAEIVKPWVGDWGNSAYAEVVSESLEKAREFDLGTLADELGQVQAAVERRQREHDEDDDAQDVFQGIAKRRGR